MLIDAYIYENKFELLYVDNQLTCSGKDNGPMKSKLIKLHKGTDNSVTFVVKNRDYKKVALDAISVRGKLVNIENNENVLEKYLTISTCKGMLCWTVHEGDLRDIPAGFYQLVIQGEKLLIPGENSSVALTPFYTDQADNIVYNVEITNQGHATPTEALELIPADWIPDNFYQQPNVRISPAIPCNSIRNHKNSIHTFAVYASEFSGTLELLGNLAPSPSTDPSEYFPIEVAPGTTTIEFSEYTGISGFTIEANLVWVKFRMVYDDAVLIEDNGIIDRIVWRS